MKSFGIALLSALFAFAPPTVFATTWGEDEIKDPISGDRCTVLSPMSSGSYIYHWPEKYEQVFWPLTDRNGIWVCPDSGFATFIGDIELDDAEKTRISAFLREAPSLAERWELTQALERVESIYALRALHPDRQSRVLRALAQQHEASGAQEKANDLRRRAGSIMEARLDDAGLELELRLQYLFVTANYAREFGQMADADARFDQLASLLAQAESDDSVKGYAGYLRALMEPARMIAPGGVLAPD